MEVSTSSVDEISPMMGFGYFTVASHFSPGLVGHCVRLSCPSTWNYRGSPVLFATFFRRANKGVSASCPEPKSHTGNLCQVRSHLQMLHDLVAVDVLHPSVLVVIFCRVTPTGRRHSHATSSPSKNSFSVLSDDTSAAFTGSMRYGGGRRFIMSPLSAGDTNAAPMGCVQVGHTTRTACCYTFRGACGDQSNADFNSLVFHGVGSYEKYM